MRSAEPARPGFAEARQRPASSQYGFGRGRCSTATARRYPSPVSPEERQAWRATARCRTTAADCSPSRASLRPPDSRQSRGVRWVDPGASRADLHCRAAPAAKLPRLIPIARWSRRLPVPDRRARPRLHRKMMAAKGHRGRGRRQMAGPNRARSGPIHRRISTTSPRRCPPEAEARRPPRQLRLRGRDRQRCLQPSLRARARGRTPAAKSGPVRNAARAPDRRSQPSPCRRSSVRTVRRTAVAAEVRSLRRCRRSSALRGSGLAPWPRSG